jgi:hypothetical protein
LEALEKLSALQGRTHHLLRRQGFFLSLSHHVAQLRQEPEAR